MEIHYISGNQNKSAYRLIYDNKFFEKIIYKNSYSNDKTMKSKIRSKTFSLGLELNSF